MSSSPFALRLATIEPAVCLTIEQIAREGARRSLQKAIEDEVAEYINANAQHVDEQNHRLVVRNGKKPPRTILSGVGPIEVKQPRVNDRRVHENGVRFHGPHHGRLITRTRNLASDQCDISVNARRECRGARRGRALISSSVHALNG